MSPETRQVLRDRYELMKPLGRGGMGEVWRARDRLLGREVAVKEVAFPEELQGPQRSAMQTRVLREAQAAAAITHQGVVTVYDVVQEEGRAYIVMELVRGDSLARLVGSEGPLLPARAAEIGRQVVAVLQAAHDRGIVHRDVKPGNVMVTDHGTVKLADFGIATLRDQTSLTMSGQIFGSPQYMAPEQARGDTAVPATDLWGLGATLFFAVEGRPPFQRDHPLATLTAVMSEELPSMPNAGPLRPVIEAFLRKDPENRPSTAQAVEMLGAAAEEGPEAEQEEAVTTAELFAEDRPPVLTEPTPAPQPEPAPPPPRRTARRTRWPAALAAVGVLGLAAAGFLFFLPEDEPAAPQRQRPSPEASAEAPSVPGDWEPYQDQAVGYRISHPPGWQIEPLDDTRTDFRDPDGGAFLRVDWTDSPGPSPVAAWRSYSREFAATHDGYQQIRIEPSTYQDFRAAEWEFTFQEGGATYHALDLGFVTGEYGFALFFQTPEGDWEAMQPTFEAFKAAFQVPS
jgi:eukaryotic-like serine/threonine-protein kinase